jgi:hypothetical protein
MHKYQVSSPKVQIAKARNKCRVCQRAIKTGEKYLSCLFVDTCKHSVGRHYTGFHELLKYCKECSIELLRIEENNSITLGVNHEKRVLEALDEMLYVRSRFNILKEIDPLSDYLKLNNYTPKQRNA